LLESDARGWYRPAAPTDPFRAAIESWRLGEARVRPWGGEWLALACGAWPRRTAQRRTERALRYVGFRLGLARLWLRPDNLALSHAEVLAKLVALGSRRARGIVKHPVRAERPRRRSGDRHAPDPRNRRSATPISSRSGDIVSIRGAPAVSTTSSTSETSSWRRLTMPSLQRAPSGPSNANPRSPSGVAEPDASRRQVSRSRSYAVWCPVELDTDAVESLPLDDGADQVSGLARDGAWSRPSERSTPVGTYEVTSPECLPAMGVIRTTSASVNPDALSTVSG
jgi:hypothetical protein